MAIKAADQKDVPDSGNHRASGPQLEVVSSIAQERGVVEMTVGMREALQHADQYSAAEIAEIAAELDYLYQFDDLPPGATMLAASERVNGCWIIVWPEPEAWGAL